MDYSVSVSDTNSVLARFTIPAFSALAIMIIARVTFNNAESFDSQLLHYTIAIIAGFIQFFCIGFITLIMYPLTYFKGATAKERIIACVLCPLVWVFIETYNVGGAFTFLEALFFGANVGFILICWHCTVMALYDMWFRFHAKKQGADIKIVTAVPSIPIVLMMLLGGLLSIEGGAYYFHTVLSGGYSVLFGG